MQKLSENMTKTIESISKSLKKSNYDTTRIDNFIKTLQDIMFQYESEKTHSQSETVVLYNAIQTNAVDIMDNITEKDYSYIRNLADQAVDTYMKNFNETHHSQLVLSKEAVSAIETALGPLKNTPEYGANYDNILYKVKEVVSKYEGTSKHSVDEGVAIYNAVMTVGTDYINSDKYLRTLAAAGESKYNELVSKISAKADTVIEKTLSGVSKDKKYKKDYPKILAAVKEDVYKWEHNKDGRKEQDVIKESVNKHLVEYGYPIDNAKKTASTVPASWSNYDANKKTDRKQEESKKNTAKKNDNNTNNTVSDEPTNTFKITRKLKFDKNSSYGKNSKGKQSIQAALDIADNGNHYINLKTTADLRHTFRAAGIMVPGVNLGNAKYDDSDLWTEKFNRWQWNYYHYTISKTREYLFFVKPNLHLTQAYVAGKGLSSKSNAINPELETDPYFSELVRSRPRLIKQLSMSAAGDGNPFCNLLTNAVCSKLDLPDISLSTSESSANAYGMYITYPGSAIKSNNGFNFTLQFYDNPNFEVYEYFNAYMKYETLKKMGMITPPGGSQEKTASSKASEKSKKSYLAHDGINMAYNPYRTYQVLHDVGGVFKIVTDDTSRILYIAYVPGIFPLSSPRNFFDDVEEGIPKYSVEFHGQFIIDSDPRLYGWFNRISKGYRLKKKGNLKFNKHPIDDFSTKYHELNGYWRDIPLISRYGGINPAASKYDYYLDWYDWT